MKRSILCMALALAVLFMVSLSDSEVWAVSAEQPPGQPPFGLAIQSDAKGTKLVGVVEVEFTNYNPSTFLADSARVLVRLRKGGDIKAFFGVIPGPVDTTDIPGVQNAIIATIGPQVITYFFNCASCVTLKLKVMEEFSVVEPSGSNTSMFVVADMTIAAN